MNNDISELRAHLFETLRVLKDGSVDIEHAKAIKQVADSIIDTAKVEVDYIQATGADGTGFMRTGSTLPPAANIRVHKLK